MFQKCLFWGLSSFSMFTILIRYLQRLIINHSRNDNLSLRFNLAKGTNALSIVNKDRIVI